MQLPSATTLWEPQVSSNLRFWLFQLGGWIAYSLITFFALTVWDENVSAPHVRHILLQSTFGMLACWPLRPLYRQIFNYSLQLQFVICALAVITMSWVWTAARLEAFMLMSGERGLWAEFNDWYFGSLFVLLSWTALYYGIKYFGLLQMEHTKLMEANASQREAQIGQMRAEAAARDTQLQMLRYQLNPHFLFNSLNALQGHVEAGNKDLASDMIQSLSLFLRRSLDQGAAQKITLAKEIDTLKLYLKIEQTRFGDRLKIDYDIESRALPAMVPGLILQPIIENSMKHAIAQSETGGSIHIQSRIVDDRLLLRLSDSGPGIDDVGQAMHNPGVGLSNTLERLQTLYGNDHTFDLFNRTEGGLQVSILIPLEYVDDDASSHAQRAAHSESSGHSA